MASTQATPTGCVTASAASRDRMDGRSSPDPRPCESRSASIRLRIQRLSRIHDGAMNRRTRRSGTARTDGGPARAARMQGDRTRRPQDPEAGQSDPPAEVHLVEVRAETLVRRPDTAHGRLRHEHRGGGDVEDLADAVVLALIDLTALQR